MAHAWPHYRPRLSSFQLQVGVRIHAIYRELEQESQSQSVKGMFGG